MEHGMYKENLSALFDGELHGAAREETLAHLDGCAECRAYFEELGALRAALGDWEEFAAPGDFAAGVMARLRAEGTIMRLRDESAPKTAKKSSPWRGYAALAACAAVVLLAVYALPNAPRIGAGGTAEDRAIQAAPSEASMEVPDTPSAFAAPSAGVNSDYDYANGSDSGDDANGMRTESVRVEQGGKADAAPSVTTDGAASSENYVAVVTEEEDEKLSATGRGEAPTAPLSGPEVWDEEFPVLTLSGEGAAAWLAENGWRGESGAWYAEASTLRALPETLTVLYSELSGDYDGAVLVELWEEEP